jgi:opacity protein-like surface antigen
MRNQMFLLLLTTALLLVAPLPARADGLITPFIGSDFGGDAGNCAELLPCDSSQLSYGVGLGFMVGGVVGFEGEFAYAPHFFGDVSGRPDNSLTTVLANVIAGVPIGAVRPYVVGGIGVIHTNVSELNLSVANALSNNSVALDVGGGLMILFSAHVGVRGDLRYLRTLSDIKFSELGLTDKQLQWARGSFGVVFRF